MIFITKMNFKKLMNEWSQLIEMHKKAGEFNQ